ncbi:MAG: hypothetical protein K2P81_02120 [Bacteriovoracaceae bacterium]|nr:hypothetical protein [Bacteriovoracaceae bacterium]
MNNLEAFQRQIIKLGESITQKMKASSFAQVSIQELKATKIEGIPQLADLELGISKLELPSQTFPQGEFSDFSITLYRCEEFCIDMYYWFHTDTSIHDHHFEGAFKVIEGASLQTRYKFEAENKGQILSEGKTLELGSEILETNSVQEIKRGEEFIHKIVHLKFPTITLCVRTPQKSNEYLSIYVPPKYSLKVKALTPLQQKKVQLLNLSYRLGESQGGGIYFESEEIVLILNGHYGKKLFLEEKAAEFLKSELQKRNYASDFESLRIEESKRTSKLKIFSDIV